jgi:uncharacterized protein YdhG (YjbR/CyaY superfamily)
LFTYEIRKDRPDDIPYTGRWTSILTFLSLGRIIRIKNTLKRERMKKTAKPTTPGQPKPAPQKNMADGESAVLANIAAMPQPDRVIAGRLHEIIKASAPVLSPRLWYGMPAYTRDGKVVCFFQSMQKFKTRYATFGFMHEANLDEGNMWPTAFALTKLTAAEEAKIAELVKKAVS